ncbi:hypothetical protein [uncultured Nocardioides sp.]|uniref:hypothetical protein n=1 Tax=uncultured Nocardioides sp. TaxID=198441 RepID=UPI0030F73972
MSTIDDLRSTLEDRARAVDDLGAPPRVVAVHERVRGLRRRRRAAAGALAAAVVAAGVGLAALGPVGGGDGPAPAEGPRTLAGQEVPSAVSVLGRDYELSAGIEVPTGEDVARVALLPSDELRTVSLVGSGLDGGTVTLRQAGRGLARVLEVGSVQPPVPVPPGMSSFSVVLDDLGPDAEVALAVYDQTGEAPGGVVGPSTPAGPVVFPAERAGEALLGAAFSSVDGAEGSEVTTRVEVDRRQDVRVSTYCTADTRRLWVHVDVDGRPAFSRPCGNDGVVDPAGGWSEVRLSGAHTLRAYLTSDPTGGPEVDDPGAVLGLGVYPRPPTTAVAGSSIDRVVERDGRLWRLETARPATQDDAISARRVVTDDEPLLIGMVVDAGIVGLEAEPVRRPGGELSTSLLGSPAGAGVAEGQLLAGDVYYLRLSEERGRDFDATILLYRPVD